MLTDTIPRELTRQLLDALESDADLSMRRDAFNALRDCAFPIAAAAPGGGVRAPEPNLTDNELASARLIADMLTRDEIAPLNLAGVARLIRRLCDTAVRARLVADSAVDPVARAPHATDTRDGSSSSSSTSERVWGLATDLRAFLDDLDCGSYGERHYMDPDDVRHIVKDLRPLADRLDVLAGESAKVDK